MKIISCIILILFFSFILSAQTKKEILAYFPQWGAWQHNYYVKHIEKTGSADKLTVINYAFAIPGPDSSGNIVVQFMDPYYDYQQVYTSEMSIDGIVDDPTQPLRGHFNQLKKLKARHPHLKFVISVGGWTGSTYFSDAALTPESREIFVNSCIDIFIKGNLPVQNGAGGKGAAAGIFDGIDIDWEFPISGGDVGIHNNIKDNDNLTELFKLFRKKLDQINPDLLLTAALPANEKNLKNFNVSIDQQYLNWFLLMTYDYSGSWDTLTGHHTNLFSNTGKDNTLKDESFDKSVQLFINKYKVAKDKILPGAAFYGRGWKNVDSTNCGLFQLGEVALGKNEPGINLYKDLSFTIGYEFYWDEIAFAPFLYNKKEKVFWTFDDPQSIALKSRYVDALDLKGMFFWEISGDDSIGTLLSTIYNRNMPDFIPVNTSEEIVPELNIVLPGITESIFEGSNVKIKVETDSSVKKVEFFGDDTLLGFDTRPPFNWVWFNIPKGVHNIRVVGANINGMTSIKSMQIHVIGR